MAKSFDCGKLGSGTVCNGVEGRKEAVVAVVLGKEETLVGSEGGEASVLGAGTDEVVSCVG